MVHVLNFPEPVHAVAQHGNSSLVATVGRHLVSFSPLERQDPQQTWGPRSGGCMAEDKVADDEPSSSSCSMLPSAMTVLKVNPSGGQQLQHAAAAMSVCGIPHPLRGKSCALAAACSQQNQCVESSPQVDTELQPTALHSEANGDCTCTGQHLQHDAPNDLPTRCRELRRGGGCRGCHTFQSAQ